MFRTVEGTHFYLYMLGRGPIRGSHGGANAARYLRLTGPGATHILREILRGDVTMRFCSKISARKLTIAGGAVLCLLGFGTIAVAQTAQPKGAPQVNAPAASRLRSSMRPL